jgi:hypothetical protein
MTPPDSLGPRPLKRWFFPAMSLAVAATVFTGFAATFYLRGRGLPPLAPLLLVHGLVFTLWVLLFILQSTLIATRRVALHRRLGWCGAVLALAMVGLGTLAAVTSLRLGRAPIPGLDPRSFFVVPMGDLAMFSLFVGAGIGFRRSGEHHRRLMLLASLSIIGAAIARIPLGFIERGGPPVFFGLTDLFLLAGCAYDLITRRRIHPAFLWGGLALVLSQPLRLVLGGTGLWLRFAGLFLP